VDSDANDGETALRLICSFAMWVVRHVPSHRGDTTRGQIEKEISRVSGWGRPDPPPNPGFSFLIWPPTIHHHIIRSHSAQERLQPLNTRTTAATQYKNDQIFPISFTDNAFVRRRRLQKCAASTSSKSGDVNPMSPAPSSPAAASNQSSRRGLVASCRLLGARDGGVLLLHRPTFMARADQVLGTIFSVLKRTYKKSQTFKMSAWGSRRCRNK